MDYMGKRVSKQSDFVCVFTWVFAMVQHSHRKPTLAHSESPNPSSHIGKIKALVVFFLLLFFSVGNSTQ